MRIEQEMIRNHEEKNEIKYIIESIDTITNNLVKIARLEETDTYLLVDEVTETYELEKFGVYIPNEIVSEQEFLDKVTDLNERGFKRSK